MKSLIKYDPKRYELWKSRLRTWFPMSEKSKLALSHFFSTIHQKYCEDFVFIHINKCGGTSLERALGIPFLNHDTALERKKKLRSEEWSQRFKFTIARNPYDRIASLYFYRHRTRELSLEQLAAGFPNWLEQLADLNHKGQASKFDSPQVSWVTDCDGRFMLDEYFKLEELNDQLSALEQRLDKRLSLQRVKTNQIRTDYHSIYDEETRQIISEVFHADFIMFNYKFR